MIRRLVTFASGMSLLLCVTLAALWVRSEVSSDLLTYHGWRHNYDAVSQPGRLVLGIAPSDVSRSARMLHYLEYDPSLAHAVLDPQWIAQLKRDATPHWQFASGSAQAGGYYSSLKPGLWEALGVGVASCESFGDTGRIGTWLVAPYWLLVGLTAIAPLCALMRRRRAARRRPSGVCTTCGYDLRASKERCPECGTPITSNAEGA